MDYQGNEMKTEIRIITPADAAMLLEGNTGNRPVRPSRVAMLADAIKRGEWMLTHQGIAIAGSGRILDGQHRLLAIIKSGISVQIAVTTGVNEAAFSAIDVHDKRTNADALQMPKHQVEAARFILDSLSIKPTIGQIGEVAREISSESDDLHAFCNHRGKIFSSVAFRVAAMVYIRKGGEYRTHALHSYRRLATADTSGFTPIEHSIFKQSLIGKMNNSGGTHRFSNFCRALTAYNKDSANLTRVYIRDDRAEYVEAIKTLIPEFIANAEKDAAK